MVTRRNVTRRTFLQMAGISSGIALAGLAAPPTSASRHRPSGAWQALGQTAEGDEISLPAPAQDGKVSLERALQTRRSQRQFTGEALTPAQLSQLLWAAQGITDPTGKRTAPSAVSLYPIDLYVLTKDGCFRYNPAGHSLVVTSGEDLRPAVAGSPAQASIFAKTGAVFLPVVVYEQMSRYQTTQAARFAYLEIGHIAQNLLLEAVAMGLGGVPQGGLQEDKIRAALSLPDGQEPVYLIPIGRVAS